MLKEMENRHTGIVSGLRRERLPVRKIDLSGGDATGWPLAAVVEDAAVHVLDDFSAAVRPCPTPYPSQTHTAYFFLFCGPDTASRRHSLIWGQPSPRSRRSVSRIFELPPITF